MLGTGNSKRRKGAGRRGVEMVEFTLVLLPLLGFTFLLLDMGWAVYKRATLQFAVREGCRYAVTNQTSKDANGNPYGMSDSVKLVVQKRAMGFLGSTPTDAGYAAIQVRFYDPGPKGSLSSAVAVPLDCTNALGTPSPNQGGNLVEVSVENYRAKSLAPLLRSAAPLIFVARSSDRMEGNPSSGVPKFLTCP